MANATYNRFRNTLDDLKDCAEHIHDPLTCGNVAGEYAARRELVLLCVEILEQCGVETINPADIEIVEHDE